MVEIECKLQSLIKGSNRWVEGVLYAAHLGARIGLGGCAPVMADSVLRLESADHSSYEYRGAKLPRGGRSGVPTIQLEEKLLLEPRVPLDRGRRLNTICAVTAHEALHHRAIVEFNEFKDDGYGGEMQADFDSKRRKIILELLDVKDLIVESEANSANLDRYWTASPETWITYHPEQNLNEAALNSRNEFLGQVSACLARLHLRYGADEVRRLVTDRSGRIKTNSDRLIPLPYLFLLEKLINSACSGTAEMEAQKIVSDVLGRSPVCQDAVLFRLRP